MMVVWFWYSMLRILDSYNATRREHLERIEETFNECYPSIASMDQCLKKTEFKQYTLNYKRKWLRVVGFDDICFIMSVFVTAILVLILQRSGIWDIQTHKIILVGFLVIFIKVILFKVIKSYKKILAQERRLIVICMFVTIN